MKRDEIPADMITKCTSCKAPVVFLYIVGQTGTSARERPVDVVEGPEGTHRLEPTSVGSKTIRAVFVKPSLAFGHTDLHRLHHATCPTRDQHRTTPRKPRARLGKLPAKGR